MFTLGSLIGGISLSFIPKSYIQKLSQVTFFQHVDMLSYKDQMNLLKEKWQDQTEPYTYYPQRYHRTQAELYQANNKRISRQSRSSTPKRRTSSVEHMLLKAAKELDTSHINPTLRSQALNKIQVMLEEHAVNNVVSTLRAEKIIHKVIQSFPRTLS